LRIEDKKRGSTKTLLKGRYLSKPTLLSPKALEHKLQVLLSSLQSKSSLASEYGVNEWISYVQRKADHIKNQALRRPASIIDGVTTPKSYRKDQELQSDSEDTVLTGVAKETEDPAITEDYLAGLLSRSGSEELEQKESHATMSSSGIFTVNASSIKHSPSIDEEEEEPFMSGVLRQDDNDIAADALTGVQHEKVTEHPEEIEKEEPAVEKSEEEETDLPEPTITPPPEEKMVKKTTSNGKKGKKKNKQVNNAEFAQQQQPIY
jgi:hypothetical protein